MKQIDFLRELLHSRTCNQLFYNQNLIELRNPECRQLFAQLRDDEMRAVTELEQRIERISSAAGIISRIFPTKLKY